MKNIAISTASFCLWDIGPKRKMDICKTLGFDRVVIAFSTVKMLRQFASSPQLCAQLSKFNHVMIHAPWCGIHYKENVATAEVFGLIDRIIQVVDVEAVIFHFDCVKDWGVFKSVTFPYYVKNPNHASWETFDEAKQALEFDSVLDINRAVRFENYLDKYIDRHGNEIKAIHVSGFDGELGRTPIGESGQTEILDRIKRIKAPIIIEGLFSPGDFQGIRDEINIISGFV